MKVEYFTGIGRRESNQDFICIEQLESGASLYLIADGMGGYEKGDEAAKIIADNIFIFLNTQNEFSESVFQKAVNKANLAIKQFNKRQGIKSGATIGGVLVDNQQIHVFWVGDVMIAISERDKVIFKTKSHTMINKLLDSNTIIDAKNIEKYKHIVSRSISGDTLKSTIEYIIFEGDSGVGNILICSDGVHNVISAEQIIESEMSLSEIEKRLKEEGNDNYSLVKIRIE